MGRVLLRSLRLCGLSSDRFQRPDFTARQIGFAGIGENISGAVAIGRVNAAGQNGLTVIDKHFHRGIIQKYLQLQLFT